MEASIQSCLLAFIIHTQLRVIEKEILHRARKEGEGGGFASDNLTLVILDVAHFVLNKKQLWSCSFQNESF